MAADTSLNPKTKPQGSKRPRAEAKHRNILPNTYTPAYTKRVVSSVLNRLAKSSILALVSLWPTLKNTQPTRPSSQRHVTQAEYARSVRESARNMKQKKWTKAKIVDAVLHEIWPSGLNLLQLAQVDCQLIVDNPNAYTWISSSVKDAWGQDIAVPLDPKVFLDKLAANLSKLFMSYIYVCTHPTFPLVLIRIQAFDLAPGSRGSSARASSLSSHKPYFLAIPMNSPHVIHSPGEDLVSQTVLQVVEASLSKGPSQVLSLETSPKQKPIRSLESMHILKGSSRFAHSMGAWAPYADGEADISPLARFENHATVLGASQPKETCTSEKEKLHKLANLRFKGTAAGEMASERLFDHPEPEKRRKLRPSQDESEHNPSKNPYASLAPISVAEFAIQEPLGGTEAEKADTLTSNVTIKLVGTDVFAGMHELAVSAESDAFLDLETLPGWLTGEEGESCGVVKQGAFHSSLGP